MFLLPKGNPLAEHVPISKLQLPDVLEKLKNGKLNGYAIFHFPVADCALFYDEGKLVTAIAHRDGNEIFDQDALHLLVDLMLLASEGNFSVYGLSRGIALSLLALVNGQATIDNQEIKLIDFRALLERIKTDQMTATLKVYTVDRFGLIFYHTGTTVGFFHDASDSIETAAREVQLIAGLPDARVDLRVRNDSFVLDLAGLVDIRSLWEAASCNVFTDSSPSSTKPENVSLPVAPATTPESGTDIEAAVIELASRYIGKLGKILAEKELMNIGGGDALKNPDKLQELLTALEKGAKMLTSTNKIKEMKETIITHIAQVRA